MKVNVLSLMLSILAFAAAQSVNADQKPSAEETKALFSNKTFDGYNELKKKPFVVYSATDGTHNFISDKGKHITGKWSIDAAGNHCVELNNSSTCTQVIAKGNGIYYKMDGSVHTHTLKNFRDGDKR